MIIIMMYLYRMKRFIRELLGLKPMSYLCGPMEQVKDCESWRDVITKNTESFTIVQNPAKNEATKTGMEVEATREHLYKLKISGKRKELMKIMEKVRQVDIEAVFNSNYIVLYWDNALSTVGTISELELAYWMKTPVYMLSKDPISKINSWLLCLTFANNGDIFRSKTELTAFLRGKYEKFITEDKVDKKVETKEEIKKEEKAEEKKNDKV